jgi:hypothetical protein
MTTIAITTNKERTTKNIERNYEAPYSTDFIELDNPKMDESLGEIVEQTIDKIAQTGTEIIETNGVMTPVNHVPVIVDVDNPAIEAYLTVKLMNDIFINPSEKISDMPVFTLVDIIVAPTENDLVIID